MAATVSSTKSQRLLSLYRTMARIRAFENAAEEASRGGVAAFGAALGAAHVRGPLHLSTGQEAVPAGVCANLARTDLLTSTHRGHGHTIAKGADTTAMMCELFGRASGCNRGKGGSMHIADFSVGMLGANGVVAAGIPIAVGAAQAIRLRGGGEIVACFFGDGAVNRGPFLEGLNWATIYRLPVLFVCEDNRYSATTATEAMTGGEARRRARARSASRPESSTATTSRRWTRRRARSPARCVPAWGRGSCTRSPTGSRATCRSTPPRTAIPTR
jgi:pyruvate dehydrogenase E1 component alpha subunit